VFVHSLDLSTRELCFLFLFLFLKRVFHASRAARHDPLTLEVESLKNGVISLAGRTFHRACILKSKFTLRELEIQRNILWGF
jgi:hypothetical protein